MPERSSSRFAKMAVQHPKSGRKTRKSQKAAEISSTLGLRFAIIAAAIAVVFAVTWGTYLAATTVVTEVEIDGARHAATSELLEMSGVRVGDTLFSIDGRLVEDRIQHHRWVKSADVTRWPTGTFSIDIDERVPVLLAVDGRGHPSHYIDSEGFTLPVDTLSRYDVPLLRGFEQEVETATRIDDHDALELLRVLAAGSETSKDLISDIVLVGREDLEIVTVPFRSGKCVRVKLGHGDYEHKLAKLVAFWEQAVIGRSNANVEWIDLRFDGQVVTKET